MKKTRITRFFSLLLCCLMLVGLLPLGQVVYADGRTVVSRVRATSSDLDAILFIGGPTTKPTFTVTEGTPAYIANTMIYWEKRDGDSWKAYSGDFTEGSWRCVVQIRIDEDAGLTHALDENVSVKINGETWTTRSFYCESTYSYIFAYSPEVTMSAGTDLNFSMSDSFNIGENYVGTAITSYSVAGNVSGGTAPYTFSKVSGPAWLNVSADGTVSGTPTVAASANENLVVKVTDQNGDSKQISIPVGKTIHAKIKISSFVATAVNMVTPTNGAPITKPTFTVTTGAPAYIENIMSGWQKKEDDNWTFYKTGNFTEGTWRYAVQIRIDEPDSANYVVDHNMNVQIDGKNWTRDIPTIGDTASYLWAYSPEFTVTNETTFAFTSQPVGGTAKKSESFTFSWALNDTPTSIVLQKYSTTYSTWGNTYSLDGLSSYSVTYGSKDVDKYRIIASKGSEDVCSDEFTVTWTEDAPTTYTVTIATPTNGSVIADKLSAAEGETVSLTVVPDDGYELDELIVKDEGTNLITLTGTSFKMPAANVNVEATFKLKPVTPITYTVTIATPTNGSVIADKLSAAEGETVSLTVVPDDGYELDELIVKDEGTNLIPLTGTSFKMPAANVNVEATFKLKPVTPITYTVTFDANGHGTAPAAQSVESGKTATKPADPSETGWKFGGWYQDKTCNVAFDFSTPITGAITLYAKWTEESVTPITYTVTGGGNSTWTKGSSSTVTITVKRSEDDANCINYFDGVEIDGTALVKDTDYTVVPGSTVVTLKAATLQKLSTGKHTVTVKFDDGKVSTDITVKAASGSTDKPTSPKTGDESNLRLWVILMLMSILGFITTVTVGRKKRQHSR